MTHLLIVATSGRMLAQAAHREGYKTVVIDCFADVDTRVYAQKVIKVTSLSVKDLTKALDALREFSITGVLYGSGFETVPDSLAFLQTQFELIGNSPATFEAVQNKPIFFRALEALGIPYPITQFSPPSQEQASIWLTKPLKGQGGMGIKKHSPALPKINDVIVYWQHDVAGQASSVLFLADGKQMQPLGFHQQLTQSIAEYPYLFKGICFNDYVPQMHRPLIYNWITQLVVQFGLRGINSLDFIQTTQGCYVLEVNPRPSASMQLYDTPIFAAHLNACRGPLNKVPIARINDGYQLVFAPQRLLIPTNFQWPRVCHDKPLPGVIIGKNQPICSIIIPKLSKSQLIIANLIRYSQHIQRSLVMNQTSVNTLTQPLVQHLINHADKLRVGVVVLENGCTIIDAGIEHIGGLEAGRIIAEICLGGMGTVTISQHAQTVNWPLSIHVHTANPVLGCLGSQYAGWSLAHEKYYALGSGPARAMATKVKEGQNEPVEELYKELAYRDVADKGTLVIENDAIPPLALIEKVANACGIPPSQLTIIVTPTSSLAGGVQVVARVLEVALHKAHALHFPLENILDGSGSAPICPPHPNFVKAMGRTNDAILCAGQVHLFVKGSDEEAERLANALPSSTSKDYGKPFADIFKAYDYDFFKIDAMLFSPASVIVTAVESGKSFRAGHIDNALLDLSFGA